MGKAGLGSSCQMRAVPRCPHGLHGRTSQFAAGTNFCKAIAATVRFVPTSPMMDLIYRTIAVKSETPDQKQRRDRAGSVCPRRTIIPRALSRPCVPPPPRARRRSERPSRATALPPARRPTTTVLLLCLCDACRSHRIQASIPPSAAAIRPPPTRHGPRTWPQLSARPLPPPRTRTQVKPPAHHTPDTLPAIPCPTGRTPRRGRGPPATC